MGLALVPAVMISAGCDLAEKDQADAVVEVPEVRDAVAIDELCELATELRCAGSELCCSESPYADVDECIAESSCEDVLGAIADSDLVADGTLVYDAEAAASMLQDLSDATAECGVESAAPEFGTLFVGHRQDGDDCSPTDDSGAHLLSCAPGLACAIQEHDGVQTHRCQPAAALTTTEGGVVEPESSFDLTADALYCDAPSEADDEPQFRSAGVPVAIAIKTHGVQYAGTSAPITVHFVRGGTNVYYSCEFPNGVGRDAVQSCQISSVMGASSNSSSDRFFIENPSGDGIAIDSVVACMSNSGAPPCSSVKVAARFDNGNTNMLRDVIPGGFGWWDDAYEYFWVDGDNSGNCNMALVDHSNDNTVTCVG
ncbi:MAG: hypothetical protein AAF799_25760 [Myxococcota bacterium]